jgi:DNA invertase Pin-like site-specific DNA recombinase
MTIITYRQVPAVYIRVSSAKGQKTDSQRAELDQWLKRQGFPITLMMI